MATRSSSTSLASDLNAESRYASLDKLARGLAKNIDRLQDKCIALENKLDDSDKSVDKLNKIQDQIAAQERLFLKTIDNRNKLAGSLKSDIQGGKDASELSPALYQKAASAIVKRTVSNYEKDVSTADLNKTARNMAIELFNGVYKDRSQYSEATRGRVPDSMFVADALDTLEKIGADWLSSQKPMTDRSVKEYIEIITNAIDSVDYQTKQEIRSMLG